MKPANPDMNSTAENGALPDQTRRVTGNPDEEAISLLDIILVVLRRRRLILYSCIGGGILALLLVLLTPPQYTSWARVIREVESEAAPGGFSGAALLRGFGLNLGNSSTGLVASAYPDIAMSREVRHMVVRDTFYFADAEGYLTFVDYLQREPGWAETVWMYTLGLPRTVRRALRSDPALPIGDNEQLYPTRAEEEAMKKIAEYVSISVDEETGLMTLAVTARHPLLAASIAESFTEHLAERIRRIRTRKARDDLSFIQEQYYAAQESLRVAENRLAVFEDRNMNPQRAQLRTEHDRLRRVVSFKSELFSDLQTQLTQAQIDLQRSEPVITVLEKPVPPIERSGPSRVLLLFFGAILGGFVGIGLAFVKQYVQSQQNQMDEQKKLEEIQGIWGSSVIGKRLNVWKMRRQTEQPADS